MHLSCTPWTLLARLRFYIGFNCNSLHCTVLRWAVCTVLPYTGIICTALNWNYLHCTTLQFSALRCTALHCTVLRWAVCTALYRTALPYTTIICTAQHCNYLHCPTLQLSGLHYTVLRCIHCPALKYFSFVLHISVGRLRDNDSVGTALIIGLL